MCSKTTHFKSLTVVYFNKVSGQFPAGLLAAYGAAMFTYTQFDFACCHPHILQVAGARDKIDNVRGMQFEKSHNSQDDPMWKNTVLVVLVRWQT